MSVFIFRLCKRFGKRGVIFSVIWQIYKKILPQMREVDFAEQKTKGETLFAKKQIVFLSPGRDNATTAPSSEGAIMFFRCGFVCDFTGRVGIVP